MAHWTNTPFFTSVKRILPFYSNFTIHQKINMKSNYLETGLWYFADYPYFPELEHKKARKRQRAWYSKENWAKYLSKWQLQTQRKNLEKSLRKLEKSRKLATG